MSRKLIRKTYLDGWMDNVADCDMFQYPEFMDAFYKVFLAYKPAGFKTIEEVEQYYWKHIGYNLDEDY